MTPDGHIVHINHPPTEADNIQAYHFGQSWKVDGSRHKLLFQDSVKPIYDPLRFGDPKFVPIFDPYYLQFNNSLIADIEEIRSLCQNNYECEFDFLLTGRREIGLNTLEVQTKLSELKYKGSVRSKLNTCPIYEIFIQFLAVSCGALLTAPGVVKYPPGNNYLDGITVTLTCKPEFFIHGTNQRTCVNGTWTPGWHVWCRSMI